MQNKTVDKFSKFTKEEKIQWLANHYFSDPSSGIEWLKKYQNADDRLQQLHDEFIENTLSNFYLPFGIAPNFLIDGRVLALPMVIEESSVVAAASRAAKFWLTRGGFKTEVISTRKTGQVHLIYKGEKDILENFVAQLQPRFFKDTDALTQNMRKRGGGMLEVVLKDKTHEMPHYYQLFATFDTRDAMGANFINSCLEQLSATLRSACSEANSPIREDELQIVMSILSNYVPECVVRAEVSCPVSALGSHEGLPAEVFAEKFVQAVQIAEVSPYRAVTHNKGIMNGVDALVLATGNDFRAVEAGVHAYAARKGQYSSLTHAEVTDGLFRFWIEIPLALGTVGGLTKLHPLVRLSHEILEHPTSDKLMRITAVAGLAQNFAALNALTTSGIQKGHMKMHLLNILNQFQATQEEKNTLIEYFKTHVVSFAEVQQQLALLREPSTVNKSGV